MQMLVYLKLVIMDAFVGETQIPIFQQIFENGDDTYIIQNNYNSVPRPF